MSFNNHPLVGGISKFSSVEITLLWLCSAPLFMVTIRDWSSIVLIIGFFICTVQIAKDNRSTSSLSARIYNANSHFKILAFSFCLPALSILISAVLRGQFYLPQLDSPLRFVIAIPIMWVIINFNLNAAKHLQLILPLALFITLIQQLLFKQPFLWGTDRMATYFADPLVFGYFTLTSALMCLVSINLVKKDSVLLISLKVAGALVGFYLSVKSGSRTGWIAVPFLVGFWAYHFNGDKKMPKAIAVIVLAVALGSMSYFYTDNIQARINQVGDEIFSYNWQGIAPETSVGLRITFLRIAKDLFYLHPWAGFGETRFDAFDIPSVIHTYASSLAIETAFQAGFHNEIVTSAIRAGASGLIAAVAVFIVPLFVMGSRVSSANRQIRANAKLGITFVICFFVSSLSTEVFDLKYTVSYYVLMVAMLCSSTLAQPHE